jgi:hypothetical protein
MKIKLFIMLMILVFSGKFACATPLVLPDSSHYEGSSYTPVNQNGDTIRIDFAVYDTQGKNGNEFSKGGIFPDAPGAGRYIYAYQIFQANVANISSLEYFGILGIGKDALQEPVNNNIGSTNDSPGQPADSGIAPDKSYIGLSSSQGTLGVWEFSQGLLTAGKHSWFLLMRSDHDWTAGKYTFDKTAADATPIPNPEPGTLVLFSGGLVAIISKYRKKRNKI